MYHLKKIIAKSVLMINISLYPNSGILDHGVMNFIISICRSLTALYALSLTPGWPGVEKKIFKEFKHFEYMTYIALP